MTVWSTVGHCLTRVLHKTSHVWQHTSVTVTVSVMLALVGNLACLQILWKSYLNIAIIVQTWAARIYIDFILLIII